MEEGKIAAKKNGFSLESFRKNPWMTSTAALGIVLLVFIGVMVFNGGITGNVVSSSDAGQNLISFINAQGQGTATLVSIAKEGSLYNAVVNYKGQDVPVAVTLDGKFLVSGVIPLTSTAEDNSGSAAAAEVPKSDKPKVEAFVFSYCPYGLQFEKALLPVYILMKNKADINIVFIGAMHGDYEKVESLRQIAIQSIYGRDKLFAYLDKFDTDAAIGSCNGDDACVAPLLDKIYSDLGIDKTRVDSVMNAEAITIYNSDMARASSLGISGSPTFVINGVQVQVNRTPAAVQKAICDAFNTAPAECSQALSSSAASAGFGGASSGSASTGTQCG
jgi:hypothetical protein